MSTGTSCHFVYLLQVLKNNLFEVWFYTIFFMILYMYIALGQGQTAPRGQSFDVNRNVSSLHSFVASFKKRGENRSWSTQGHNLNKLGSTRAPDAAYQLPLSSAFWFRRRRFLKVFTINGHGDHLGHVIWTVWTNSHGGSIWNLTLIGPVVSEEKMFKECGRQTTDDGGLLIL